MAAALSEPRDAIEDIIEPFLIQCGYLQRTRGRLLTSRLQASRPRRTARDPAQFGLFGSGGRATTDVALLLVAASAGFLHKPTPNSAAIRT